jgi:hypothetical protein
MKSKAQIEYEELQKQAFEKEFKENTKVRDIYEPWSGGLAGNELYKVLKKC